jgi:putative transposase
MRKKFLKIKFLWQEGYGAFSYSHSQLDEVIHYIKEQQEHHRKRTFKEEYISLLKKYDVPYDPKYVFDIDE